MSIVTLTTDLGQSSPAAGQLSGIIWRIAPETRIINLTHEIPPFDLISAQVVLENTLPYFPEGVIHLAAVSPTSGKANRPIAARLGPMQFVGPDDGMITPLLERAEANRWPVEVYHANRSAYWLSDLHPATMLPVTAVFASLAGHLANGMPMAELGDRISDPVRSNIPAPEMLSDGWRGQVIQTDHFGNLAANIKRSHLEDLGDVQVQVGGVVIAGLSRTFGDGQPGDLIAMIDSSNHLSICVVNGSAAERLKVHNGDPVEVHLRRA